MIVPLAMTLWFSFQYYNLLDPPISGFAGLDNYRYLLTDPALLGRMANTLCLVFWVLVVTVGLGTLLAVLFNEAFYGRKRRAAAGHRAVLRHAHGERADLEESADAPGERRCSPFFARSLGLPADRFVRQTSRWPRSS